MKVGIFTDTYYPQVSGVATSILTLKEELEKDGHEVTIFTTTDPNVIKKEKSIIRFSSIPFLSFKDRRVAIRGKHQALKIAKKLEIDIIHTQTEFSLGMTGKYVAEQMNIPCVHTYHTMYEKYLHYVANGKVLRPSHVKILSKHFCNQADGVIAPSEKTKKILLGYGVKQPIEVIPTGVNLQKLSTLFDYSVREELGISKGETVLLSLSRLAKEKNIECVISAMPAILNHFSNVKLMIVGDGPSKTELKELVNKLNIAESVIFVGEVSGAEVGAYYQASDLYVSASDSETQGLTYIEAIASGIDIVTKANDYTNSLIRNGKLGTTYNEDEQLAEIVIDYLEKSTLKPSIIQERESLLKTISSEAFKQNVVQFYRQTLERYYSEIEMYPNIFK